jgi:2'-5' RNA ligase
MVDRFFIALLPPQEIQAQARSLQQEFVDRYDSRAALKSLPHITLQPPFEWLPADLPRLLHHLEAFAAQQQGPTPVTLSGFEAFAPRVIYIQVLPTLELLTLQQELKADLESIGIVHPSTRAFTPHITVALHDLTPQNFQMAWAEFQSRPFTTEFTVPDLTLLRHDGQCWQIEARVGVGSGGVVG